jgi:osmotically inducible protein OsmC
MAVVRKAHARWEGDLLSGKGVVGFESGSLPEVPVTWEARSRTPGGKTSPEELLAAAHATCFAMALSNGLAKASMPSEHMTVKAACTFDKVGDGFKVTGMDLEVTAKIAHADRARFEELARTVGEKGCPISQALQGNVPIKVTAKLEP